MDISMPFMDGFAASSAIRQVHAQASMPQPKIVACTGHVEKSFIKKAWAHEIDEVVPKPIKIEVIAEIFEETIKSGFEWFNNARLLIRDFLINCLLSFNCINDIFEDIISSKGAEDCFFGDYQIF